VKSPGVFIEGNSFSEFVNPDHFIMVRQSSSDKIKSSARRLMNKATAIYISDNAGDADALTSPKIIPHFSPAELPVLIRHLQLPPCSISS